MAETYNVLAILSAEDNMSDAFNRASGATRSLGSTIGKTIKTGALMQVGMKAVSGVMSTVSSSVGSAVSRFDTLNNFPKIMSNLGVSADDASAQLDRASKAMKNLPTALDDAASGIQRMTATNGDVKKSTDYFLAMNDAIIAGGQSSQVQASALEQLSQSYSKGKMDMQEWRSLQQAMPAQLNQVAEAMGTTSTALGEGLRDGSISMDDFMDTLVKLDQNGGADFASFKDQAEDACSGIQTAFTNVKTAITRGLANALKSIDEALQKGGLPKMGEMLNNLVPVIDNVASKAGNLVTAIVEHKDQIIALGVVIGAIATGMALYNTVQAAKIAMNLAETASLGTLIAAQLSAAAATLAAAAPYIIAAVAIAALIAVIVICIKNWDKIKKAVSNVAKSIKKDVLAMVKAVKTKFNEMKQKIVSVAKNIVEGIKKTFNNLPEIGRNIVKGLWNGAKSMVSWVVNKFAGLGKSILKGIKNALGIHSPSKEFAKVGKYSAMGLVKGLDSMHNRVQNAAANLMSTPSMTASGDMSLSSDYSYGINGSYEVVVPLTVDGKEFARATATYTQGELNKRQIRSNRKLGVI